MLLLDSRSDKMLLTSSELLVKRLLNAEYGNKWLQKLQEFQCLLAEKHCLLTSTYLVEV